MNSKQIALLALLILIVTSSAVALYTDSQPVAFQSLESKTPEGKPVFNRITFYPSAKKDIWVMQQSHSGYYEEFKKWDRIAIAVDKSVEPKTAQFYQLEPGDSVFEAQKKVSLKVSCFVCHANGPRAVRADFSGKDVSFSDKIKIQLWNLRIKTYGKIEADGSANMDSKVPLKHDRPFDNETLEVKTCLKCHSGDGSKFFARSKLKRQHFMAIKFLIEQNMMPPPGFSLPDDERAAALAFANGL